MRSLGHVENIAYDGSVLVRAAFAPMRASDSTATVTGS
jgi:hypothetical protein